MADKAAARGTQRDRHGRGIRQPLLSNLFRNGGRAKSFDQIVAGACDYLQASWPEELADLKWQVLDAPTLGKDAKAVRRWAVKREEMTIVIYRLPIERLGHPRRTDALHERMHIEEYVFTAVGNLLGKDPWELVPEKYRP